MPSSPLGRIGGQNRSADQDRLDPLALGRTNTTGAGTSGHRAFTPGTSEAGSLNLERQLRGQYEDDASTISGDGARSAMDEDATPRRPRPRAAVDTQDIPPVVDEVGERVREGFAQFLESFVDQPLSGSPDPDGEKEMIGRRLIV